MASLKVIWKATFADSLVQGDVVSLHQTGAEPFELIGEPVKRKNLVGERRFVTVRACLWNTACAGQMTFRPSECVYVRTDEI